MDAHQKPARLRIFHVWGRGVSTGEELSPSLKRKESHGGHQVIYTSRRVGQCFWKTVSCKLQSNDGF